MMQVHSPKAVQQWQTNTWTVFWNILEVTVCSKSMVPIGQKTICNFNQLNLPESRQLYKMFQRSHKHVLVSFQNKSSINYMQWIPGPSENYSLLILFPTCFTAFVQAMHCVNIGFVPAPALKTNETMCWVHPQTVAKLRHWVSPWCWRRWSRLICQRQWKNEKKYKYVKTRSVRCDCMFTCFLCVVVS